MWRLIKFMITGDYHLHTFEVYEMIEITKQNSRCVGVIYIMKCVKCGKLVTKKVKDY